MYLFNAFYQRYHQKCHEMGGNLEPPRVADSDDRDQPFRDDGDQRSEMIAISGGHPVDGELVSVLDVGVNLDAGVGAPQAIAFELDAMGVVNEAVEDRIGVSGVGYGVMP